MARKYSKKLVSYKRDVVSDNISRKELERIVNKQINKANEMLSNIKRKHGKKLSWAGRKLETRLSAPNIDLFSSTKKLILKPKSTATRTQLIATSEAINKFMESKTSTNKGIELTKKQHRDYLKEITDDPDFIDTLSDEDIDNVYRIYNDREIRSITDFIDPSELFMLCIRAKQYNMTYTQFEEMLLNFIGETNNLDFRDSIIRVYNMYVVR